MTDRRSGMVQSFGYPQNGSIVSRAVAAAAANNHHSNRNRGRGSKRYSVSVFYSMAAEQDVEVEDELAKAQKRLRELKNKISTQSKKNFMRERDVRFLDARIGLLIQNRMALDEQHEVTSRLEDNEEEDEDHYIDDRRIQQYGNLFYLLQSEPRHIAILCRLVNLAEIDTLLQTVMFTLYGNQYESREEHLLLTMFQNVLAAQFETTTEFASLLRANTPVSRMMTTYTRRGPGQSYLKSVLSDKINNLLEQKDLNFQINPLKVYEELVQKMEREGSLPDGFPRSVTAEMAAANSTVQTIILPRLKSLMEIANSFLSTIIDSLDQVPYGIRWICKQIRSLTKRKYPDATEHAISSLIGGFFFLRFVNPAIVTPQAYMLVDRIPGPNSRTTLTLVAKMLQNLANKPSYAKEAYMIPTNPFVELNKHRTIRFLNDLCEVVDFYEQLEMDQYMALSKKDIMINITPNEIYNTISLLQQHIHVLAPKETDHLRVLLSEVGLVPPQVSRKENKTIELPLFSRWEMPIQDLTMSLMSENNITQNDILYMEAKSIFVQIIRSLPFLARPPLRLHQIAEAAGTSKDAQLVHKGIKVKEMLRELEEANVIDRRDNHQFLVEEINNELAHLGDLKVKVMEELESLESVYKTILDHNNYLKSQLESYKAYLQNVRMQSSNKKNNLVGVEIVMDQTKKPCQHSHQQGPFKFTHQQLERDGIIAETEVPENRRQNIFLTISSPIPGTFIIGLHYKGRDKPVLEIDLKLDDLLEKQQDNIQILDLEYIKLNVPKTLQLITKTFMTRNRTGFFS
ncbi:Rho GTPase activation protein [Cokeromyces recurvatus]|uniref:Rho GTPase activation protein n=1 Tax=Cokeromyces recurvatus TaxID=90255 RepID=UPI002220E3DB|nr:Rho GTPase activation protein [Cokeromyces recurvatus]KAI7900718.1 Rho GTPase activation protein [Cokeromyces recurvatus]